MLVLLVGAFAFAPAQPAKQPATHEDQNPLFKSLLDPGLTIGKDQSGKELKAKFPPPAMPDGLDAVKQKAVITALVKDDYNYEDFTRKSIVAPQLLKLRDIMPSDPKAPARGVDVWFVAYGDLKSLDDEKFLDRLVNAGKGEGKGKGLKKEDLEKRKIKIADEKREGYGYVEFDFLEKVHLKATGRAVWSKTDESVLVAAEVDPRFGGDAEFPNQWQSIIREGGTTKLGPATPWSGAAMYLKITRLHEPAGALFVEQHIIFVEPQGWFDGANLLRSKLPLVVQNNVRTMRKEWAKAK
jgi:hypothetical protein